MDNQIEETKTKPIRFPLELLNKIEEMAKKNQRDFSKQVRYMCEEYIKIKEGN